MRGDARLKAACGLLWLLSLILFSETTPLNRESRMVGSDKSSEDSQEGSGLDQLVPIRSSANETQNGCSVGDILYQYGEAVPGSGPCEKCSCDPLGVSCNPVQCQVKAGCKALHRADHCCPLYQCECERNGTIYSNGEKLVDPNPCQVCYCQSGEIVCNQIACFRRHDCEPLYVSGRCCPEYDHCPPREKDIENHIPQSDSTSSSEDKHKLSNKDGNTVEKVITSNSGNSLSGNNVNNLQLNNNDYYAQSGNIENGTNKHVIISVNDLSDNSKNNFKNKPEKSQTINIKEVTGLKDKPVNEIRIKEILPAESYDASLTSTKSPTITREVNKLVLEDFIVKEDEVTIQPKENQEHQTPPVLRIGDQLLYLNVGDLVPENAAVNTPSSVFTVIGAEGLQRGVEDQEDDSLEGRSDLLNINGSLFNESTTIEFSNETQLLSGLNDTLEETSTNTQTDLLRSSISDADGFLTINPLPITPDFEVNNTEYSININDNTTPRVENISDKEVITDLINDEEQQSIPIEHLPEHNPEYPPIPEDIMILSMTEEPVELGFSEVDFSGVNPVHGEDKDEQKKVVKRPVMPMPPVTKQNKNVANDKESKIIQEVIQLANNETNTSPNASTLIPEEWLKTTPNPESTSIRFNSPLIDLNLALPDSILNEDIDRSDESSEEDNKEYIFISNSTKEIGNEESSTKNAILSEAMSESNEEDATLPDIILSNQQDSLENTNQTELLLTFNLENINDNNTNETESSDSIYAINNETNSLNKTEILNEYATVENVQEFTDDTITNLVVSTEKSTPEILETTKINEIVEDRSSPNKDSEIIENYNPLSNPEFFENPSVKQKKTPVALSDSSAIEKDPFKKGGNILADLINLVGDVASIGVHDVEVSSVHNSLEFEKYTAEPSKPQTESSVPALNVATSVPDSISEPTVNHELSEFHPGEAIDHETTTEHEKIELTTKKIMIDKDSDERNKWKSTDHIAHEIEIIPKVENKVSSGKNESSEKIIVSDENPYNTIPKETIATKKVTKVTTSTPEIAQTQTTTKKENVNLTTKKIQKPTTTTITSTVFVTESTTQRPVTNKLPSSTSVKPKKPVTISTTQLSRSSPSSTTTQTPVTEPPTTSSPNVSSSTPKVKSKPKPTKLSVSTTTTTTTTTTVPTTSLSPEPDATVIKPTDINIENDFSSLGQMTNIDTQDKLSKRETAIESQIHGLGEQKEMSLVSILKDFFEKQYRQ